MDSWILNFILASVANTWSIISRAVFGVSKISYHIIPSSYAEKTKCCWSGVASSISTCLCRSNLATKTILASSCSVMATCMHGDISLEQMSPHPKTMTEPRAGFSLSPPRRVVYPNLELQPLPLLNKPPDVAISRWRQVHWFANTRPNIARSFM